MDGNINGKNVEMENKDSEKTNIEVPHHTRLHSLVGSLSLLLWTGPLSIRTAPSRGFKVPYAGLRGRGSPSSES